MSLQSILQFVNTIRADNSCTIGEGYGTENFCLFLYSLIKLERPRVIVELGIGAGVTSCLAAQALKENGAGMLWGVDDGSAWPGRLQSLWQAALGYSDKGERYSDFVLRLLRQFELESFVTHIEMTIGEKDFYAPPEKIDLLFADAGSSGPEACVNLLRYYLPRMSDCSSIFIDRASTINHSYLLLNYMVEQLNHQYIPLQIRSGIAQEYRTALHLLVAKSHFSLVHLTDHSKDKANTKQNSRAWIKIEPVRPSLA